MEYLNLYDKEGRLIKGKGIRGEENKYLIGIVLIFIENSNGEFLIQKTSPAKNYEFATTGGHVTYGDTFEETVIKEVKEELGIDISKDKIQEVTTYIREKYIQKIYYLKKDIEITDIEVQKSEVEYVKWITIEEIDNLIKNNEFRKSNIEAYRFVTKNIK